MVTFFIWNLLSSVDSVSQVLLSRHPLIPSCCCCFYYRWIELHFSSTEHRFSGGFSTPTHTHTLKRTHLVAFFLEGTCEKLKTRNRKFARLHFLN